MNGVRSGVNPSPPRPKLREKLGRDIWFWEERSEFRNVVSSGAWVLQISPGRSGDLAADPECVPHELGLSRDERPRHGRNARQRSCERRQHGCKLRASLLGEIPRRLFFDKLVSPGY